MIRGSLAHDDPTVRRGRSFMLHALWGGTGFVAGILFWHFVGFWSLIHSAVLGHDQTHSAARRTEGALIETGSVPQRVLEGCVALVRDRTAGGTTRSAPCPEVSAARTVERGLGRKVDRSQPRS
jgi:hypothetical protein